MKKHTTSERLQEYMKMYNLKQVDILEMAKPHTAKYGVKLNKNDLSQYVSGKVEPGQDKTFILSKALNVDPAWIMGLDVPMRKSPANTNNHSTPIPLLGTIAAGTPILAQDNIERHFYLDSSIKANFALRIKGDSMINVGINEGDIVFIRQQPDIENGEIGAVQIQDIDCEATLKRVYKDNNSMTLVSENPKYPPKVLTSGNVRILGKLVAVLSMKE